MPNFNFKTTGFKQLIDSILKEFQAVDDAGANWYWYSQDNFKNSYYHDEYPVDGEDENYNEYAYANDGSGGYEEGTANILRKTGVKRQVIPIMIRKIRLVLQMSEKDTDIGLM